MRLACAAICLVACSSPTQGQLSEPPVRARRTGPSGPFQNYIAVGGDADPHDMPGPMAAVGLLLRGRSLRDAKAHCTVTLVACNAVLTARHCIHVNNTGSEIDNRNLFVFLPHVGAFEVERKVEHPASDANADIAMLYLKGSARLAHFAEIALEGHASSGTGHIVGFGRGKGNTPSGLRRRAAVTYSTCGRNQLCWSYHPGLGGTTCSGDSGGPLFEHGTFKLLGVHSTGTSSVCGQTDNAVDVDLVRYRSTIEGWLRSADRRCSRSDLVIWNEGDEDTRWVFDVTNQTSSVRVGLTSEFDGASRSLVVQYRGASGDVRECREQPDHAWALCELDPALVGEYWAWVEQQPHDRYQLSFTLH